MVMRTSSDQEVAVFDAYAGSGLDGQSIDALRAELLHGNGFVRLRGLASPEACGELRAASLRKAAAMPFDGWPGVWSKRVKDPLEWGGDAATVILNQISSRAGALLDDILGPRSWITSVHTLALFPVDETTLSSEAERRLILGSLHSDYPYGEFKEGMDRALEAFSGRGGLDDGGWQFPADFHQPRTLQFALVLDEFTRERGATRVLPRSAQVECKGDQCKASDAVALGGLGTRIPDPRRLEDSQCFDNGYVAVEGVAGDALVYIGHTWHTIAVNRGKSPRVALLIQASPFYFAPLEAAAWVTPLSAERRLTRRARELLGLPGTTIEGVGGEGECSSRVPHRSEPRPLSSCALFATDTLIRMGTRAATIQVALTFGSAAVAAALASACRPEPFRVVAVSSVAVAAVAGGYILGATATLRRFDF